MKRHLLLILAFTALVGCSLALGKHYTPYKTVPGGMGVVYVYSADATALQHVYFDRDGVDGRVSHTLSILKDGYYPFLGNGPIRVLSGPADKANCVVTQLQPNTQQWVRVSSEAPYVLYVSEDEALPEITGKREMSRDSLDTTPAPFPTANCDDFM